MKGIYLDGDTQLLSIQNNLINELRNWSAGDGGADRYSCREKFVNVVEGRLKTSI